MKKEETLGLPLEYQEMPEYFDAHNISADTEATNGLIEHLLKAEKVRSVLDLTCGTGSQVLFLARRGYEVTGSDFSPALLEYARAKAKKERHAIPFVEGDMRYVQLGKFDAVITIFNAIGHLTKEGFSIALQNIRHNLKEGGVYLFDIFNLQAMTAQVVQGLAMETLKTGGNREMKQIQYSTLDEAKGRLVSHDAYTLREEGGETRHISNSFSLQLYTANELAELLAENGFDVVQQCDMEGNPFQPKNSLSILTVARKADRKR